TSRAEPAAYRVARRKGLRPANVRTLGERPADAAYTGVDHAASSEVAAAEAIGYADVGVRDAQAVIRVMRPDRAASEAATVEAVKSVVRKEDRARDDAPAEPVRAPTPSAPSAPTAEEGADEDPAAETEAETDGRVIQRRIIAPHRRTP